MTAATPDSAISPPAPERRLARLFVDSDAINANWRVFQQRAGRAEAAAVVKADGYGLGAVDAARATARAGARTFFTATFGEALEVRAALGPTPDIFVLNGPRSEDAEAFATAGLIPVLNSLAQMALWRARGPAALHIDTGMNRLGLAPGEASGARTLLPEPALVMSHLACAATPAHAMNARQLMRFREVAALFPSARKSLAATAGSQLGPDYLFDLIRPGIGLFGSGGLEQNNAPLACAARIEAPILQVRDVAPGESFGYGATATAPHAMRAATVAIGYADGFLRALSGRGYGVLGGAKRPLLGRVSMDLVTLDVTGCPEAQPGAMVEFLGPCAPLDDVAACAGTAPYEILTTFAGTVRRGARA